ncbi:MAG TPA: ABC transporter substrate-binding protein, partial [Candidatus Dormibacteraeota bacterium]|nr:ABC transporter substrate-binding protein [Candidatus Dormibacteraeota bacterium]
MTDRLLRFRLGALALAGVLLVAACGSGGSASNRDVLHLAYLSDMSTPDPDVFYDIEGNTVILSVYQSLLQYKPDSTQLEGSLATSWIKSPDGLTYTFTLRSGVKFSDGTTLDSKAVETSFQRRTNVNQASGYMLADVDHYETPSPLTFVVVLKAPVTPFLDFMASAWAPKVISAKALTDNAGTDFAQTWAQTHMDGTGPYMLTKFDRGHQYVLERNPNFWGPVPHFKEIDIAIEPNMETQRLELNQGNLDAILHSYPVAELGSAKSNSSLKVLESNSFLMPLIYFNLTKTGSPLGDVKVRKALAQAMDIPGLVSSVYGDIGSLSTSVYPKDQFDPTLAPITYTYDLNAAKAVLPKNLNITIAYTSDESGIERRSADLIQQKLALAGVTATESEVQLTTVYNYISSQSALDAAPDILLATNTPD